MNRLFSGMKANLLWYIPLSGGILIYFIIPNLTSGYQNTALVFHRFSWLLFISPSAYLFLSSVLASVFFPIQLLLLIPVFFDPETSSFNRRYLKSFAIFVGIAVSCFLIQVIIWGSFPLPLDSEGYIHLRMIPFLPWPETPLFH
jgi:hypothetical protein